MTKEKEYQVTLTKTDVDFLLEFLAILEEGFDIRGMKYFKLNYDPIPLATKLHCSTKDGDGDWL